jgi:hypothetical protein
MILFYLKESMALAAAASLGSRLLPFAIKGGRALFKHIKEHHDEKLASKGQLVPHQLNLGNAADLLGHASKVKDTMNALLKEGVGSTLTHHGILSKYSNLRSAAPSLLDTISKTVKAFES